MLSGTSVTINPALELASLVVLGPVNLNGQTVTTSGLQRYDGAVTLLKDTVLTSTGGGTITFESTIDGLFALAVNTAGDEQFNGRVGTLIAPLVSLKTDDDINHFGGKVRFNVAGSANGTPSVATSGLQTYNDAVQLLDNTVLTSTGGGTITFASTIDGLFALVVNSAGDEQFNGNVGTLTNPLVSLKTDDDPARRGGKANFNVAGSANGTPSVATSGLQTYNDAVQLLDNTVLTSTGDGTITFASTIDGLFALVVNSAGDEQFNGRVGTLTGALASLKTDDDPARRGGKANFNVAGSANGTPSVATSGLQTYNDAVQLLDNTVLTSTAAGTITFASTIDGLFALVVNSAGDEQFNGNVGTLTNPLVSLKTDDDPARRGGKANFNVAGSANGTPSVATSGLQTYNDAVQLLDNTVLTSTAAGTITFASTIDGLFALVVNSAGDEQFNGNVGTLTNPLVSLKTDDDPARRGGKANFNVAGSANGTPSVATSGLQTYNDAVQLLDNTVLTSTAAGTITFASTIDGLFALVVNSAGDEQFNGRVGTLTNPLVSLKTDDDPARRGGKANFNVAGSANGTPSVATSGLQTYNDAVQLLDNTVVTSTGGGTITFASTIDGLFALVVNTAGDEQFNGRVGTLTGALASLKTDDDPARRGGKANFNVAGSANGHTQRGHQRPADLQRRGAITR